MTGSEQKRRKDEWTLDRESRLKALWGEKKLSARAIANELNTETPSLKLTRSAVIGKAHRMGLDPKARRGGRTRRYKEGPKEKRVRTRIGFNFASQSSKPQKVQEPRPPKETLIAPAVEGGLPLIVLKTSQCHAVVKEHCYQTHELARYCGNPTYGEFAYCEGHYVAFHQPPRGR